MITYLICRFRLKWLEIRYGYTEESETYKYAKEFFKWKLFDMFVIGLWYVLHLFAKYQASLWEHQSLLTTKVSVFLTLLFFGLFARAVKNFFECEYLLSEKISYDEDMKVLKARQKKVEENKNKIKAELEEFYKSQHKNL